MCLLVGSFVEFLWNYDLMLVLVSPSYQRLFGLFWCWEFCSVKMTKNLILGFFPWWCSLCILPSKNFLVATFIPLSYWWWLPLSPSPVLSSNEVSSIQVSWQPPPYKCCIGLNLFIYLLKQSTHCLVITKLWVAQSKCENLPTYPAKLHPLKGNL